MNTTKSILMQKLADDDECKLLLRLAIKPACVVYPFHRNTVPANPKSMLYFRTSYEML